MTLPQPARRPQVVQWTPPRPYGELSRSTCEWLGSNLWMAEGPPREVGLILADARRFGTVEGDRAQPTSAGMVLVNFTVTPRVQPRPAAQSFSPAARPGADAELVRFAVEATVVAQGRPTVPRWAIVAGVAALALGAGSALAVWAIGSAIEVVDAHAKEIIGAILAILLGGAVLARIATGGGGASGTWKTN